MRHTSKALSRVESPVRLAALLALLAMFGPFTIDAFFPAFHEVERALHASPWAMQQTISIYLLAYALMSLFHGPLSDAYGRRRVILWGVAIFTLSSIGCSMANSIEQLLIFRALQGFSTGAGLIVGRAIVRDLYHGPEAQRVMSLITVFFSIAPALAPLVGGIMFQLAGWHAVFWFLSLYGAALLLLCIRVLPETHPPEARTRFAPRPLLEIYKRIGADWRFQLLVLSTGFNFGAFFIYIASAPAFVEKMLGLGTLGYPWFFIPAIGGMMLGAMLSTRLAGRLSPRGQVKLGYGVAMTAIACNLVYCLVVSKPTAPWAVLPVSLFAVGNALIFPVLSLKMLDRYPHNRGAASSLQGFLWGAMTSLIAGVVSPAVSNTPMHLALTAAVSAVLGMLCWMLYARHTPVKPIERPEVVIEEQMEL